MRVMFVAGAFAYGGQERYVIDLASSLLDAGHEVLVVTNRCAEFESALGERSIPYELALELSRQLGGGSRRRLQEIVRIYRPSLVHAHGTRSGLLCALSRLHGVPLVWHRHVEAASVVDESARLRPIKRMAYKLGESLVASRCEAVVSVSHGLAQSLRLWPILPRTDCRTIPNGLNPPSPRRTRGSVRAELGVDGSEILIGAVGRLNRQKALHVFLDAFAQLKTANVSARGVVVGDGELRESLETHAERLGIVDSLTFLGFRSDAPDLINAFDIFCLPSLFEGLPLAALEAMALGCPVVATDVVGSNEAVTHGETGLLVPAGDHHALAGALATLSKDRQLREKMSQTARCHFAAKFTYEKMFCSVLDLYGDVIAAA